MPCWTMWFARFAWFAWFANKTNPEILTLVKVEVDNVYYYLKLEVEILPKY